MTGRISYMGTKRELAPAVLDVIELCQPGRVLDAFAGMGAIAESLAGRRQVWTNDVQHFAHLAASCRFTDHSMPLNRETIESLALSLFKENFDKLEAQNADALQAEAKANDASDFASFKKYIDLSCGLPPKHEGSYGCFTGRYSHGYFSLKQSAQIDSIRYALEILRGQGAITAFHFNWAILALGAAVLRGANTTGHFAQFLRPSESNYKRVISQFNRDMWNEWLNSIELIKPVGTTEWRVRNMSTLSNGTSLLRSPEHSRAANVVYCDPPYTSDQYSRYYHIWETLVLYDYPNVTGKGRYRPGRFTTDFCLSGKVVEAFETLVSDVAAVGADLILSYPTNGLLHKVGACPLEIMRRTFPNACLAREIQHRHSTMGASKGPAATSVAERIYVAFS